jgi:hypothetical protein
LDKILTYGGENGIPGMNKLNIIEFHHAISMRLKIKDCKTAAQVCMNLKNILLEKLYQ